MSAVWGTIRDALKAAVYTDFNAMPMERESAMLDAMAADLEAKLPLLTPEQAAVLEAAKRYESLHSMLDARSDIALGLAAEVNFADVELRNLTYTLRAQEGA